MQRAARSYHSSAKASALPVHCGGEPLCFLAVCMAKPEPGDPERQQFDPRAAAVGLLRKTIGEDQVRTEGLLPADPFIVVEEVATTVQDRPIAVELNGLRMVRTVTVNNVHLRLIDQPVCEAAVRLRDVIAPVRPPMDRHDRNVAHLLLHSDAAGKSLGG